MKENQFAFLCKLLDKLNPDFLRNNLKHYIGLIPISYWKKLLFLYDIGIALPFENVDE